MKLGFASRIAIMLAVILVAGVTMTGVLSIDKFKRTFGDLLTSRFQFVVNDIRHRIETQMDLGLALVELQNVSEELETYLALDDTILSIEVFDENSTVLFSTDPSFIGDLVSEDWVTLWRSNSDKAAWSTLERHAGVVGVSIRNNLNQTIGSLALRYSRDILDTSASEQTERLFWAGLLIAAGMALLSFLGVSIFLNGPCRDLKNMSQAMKDITSHYKNSTSLQSASESHPEFASFSASALSVQDELKRSSQEINSLDE